MCFRFPEYIRTTMNSSCPHGRTGNSSLSRCRLIILGVTVLLALCPLRAGAQVIQHQSATVSMSDGVRLQADVFLPRGEPPFPAILIRTPYGRNGYETAYAPQITGRGYALVVQSVRGTGGSEGQFIPFVHERRDGYDTAEWLASERWSSGNIGLYGPSYASYASLILAAEQHPAIEAVVNVSGWGELGPLLYPGGAYHLQLSLPWNLLQLGLLNDNTDWNSLFYYTPLTNAIRLPDGSVHPAWEAGARLFAPGPRLEELGLGERPVEVPVLHITGWHDFVYRGTLAAYHHVRRYSNVPQQLVVGPWYHDQQKSTETRVGDEDFGPAAALGWERMHALALDWFDRWMKAESPRPPLKEAPVRVFVMGLDEWVGFETWPPAEASPVRWYLTSRGDAQSASGDGELIAALPHREGADSFTYDPNKPVPTSGGVLFHFFPDLLGPRDQRSVESRDDVLVYTSAPFSEAVDLVGPIRSVLHVSVDRVNADFTAKLVVVRPDGYARIVEDGIVRARYREGLSRPRMLTPEVPVRLEVDLGATALRVRAGDRLRLEISGGNFPKYDRNPGDETPSLEATTFNSIEQTVYHGGDRASYIEVYTR